MKKIILKERYDVIKFVGKFSVVIDRFRLTYSIQPEFTCSNSTTETPDHCEVCSKLPIQTPG